jgi:NAD(P)-dependent dehydrogenase (short-subunit alcohol dehydrogenase family)/acyl carrier protein
LIPLSAKTETALEKMTQNLALHFRENPNIHLADAAYTLQVGRKAFRHRTAVVCSTLNEAVEILSSSSLPGGSVQTPSSYTGEENRFIKTGQSWARGAKIDWMKLYTGEKRRRISLPTYPFESNPYWLEPPPPKNNKRLEMVDWFYIPQWKRSTLFPAYKRKDIPLRQIPLLVFIDEWGLGYRLLEAVEKENGKQDIIIARKGETFKKTGDREYTLNPGESSHYLALLKELEAADGIPGHIIHLWGITQRTADQWKLTVETLEETMDTCFYSLIYLARAIGILVTEQDFYLAVITNNLHEVMGGDGLYPEKALMLGPLKVIPQEYPNIICRSIDIHSAGPGNPEEALVIHQLAKELTAPAAAQTTALRGNYRWTRSFESMPLEESGPGSPHSPLKPGGVYLVTGGLGGIGFTLAQSLVERVQARVVLTSRSAFPGPEQWRQWLDTHDENHYISRGIRKVRELENKGGQVLVLQADAACKEEMQAVIFKAKERFGHIDGVIHAAGLADGGMIQRRSKETSEAVLAPKVIGTLLLDILLEHEKPDFIMLCSSLSSLYAPFGQVAYCSANAFLDAFARYKAAALTHKEKHSRDISKISQNSPFIFSINWGVWQEVGMAVEAVKQLPGDRVPDPGTFLKDEISPEEGVEVFNRVLESRLPQVCVQASKLPLTVNPFLTPGSNGPAAEQRPTVPLHLHQRPDLSTKYIEPKDQPEQNLAETFQNFLGIEKIGINDNFFELGMSSLDLVQISIKLREKLEKEIPVVKMFMYSTIRTLSQYVNQEEESNGTASGKIEEQSADSEPGTSEELLQDAVDLFKEI